MYVVAHLASLIASLADCLSVSSCWVNCVSVAVTDEMAFSSWSSVGSIFCCWSNCSNRVIFVAILLLLLVDVDVDVDVDATINFFSEVNRS